ncbi:phage tail protein [Achromobacter insolitus]|uniref:phage tail protein n=1 Tax=Achromobacter insolitus TaxID=217204 RepID=UPI0028A75447|nr:phage tail protein [Achromobacter insolitus]
MRKARELREFLTRAVPLFEAEPDRLQVFIDKGKLIATGVPGLSHEYRFTLSIIITDFTGEADTVMLPVLAWMLINQADAFATPEQRENALSFMVDFNNSESMDIEIQAQITERVTVQATPNQGYAVQHQTEPIDEWEPAAGAPLPVTLDGSEIARLPWPLGKPGE